MPRHLILTLEGPLAAYGAEMVDALGPVREWPGASLLTGLLANALGWTRGMGAEHARLQARLRFAIRIDRDGRPMRDFQTAQLAHNDRGWTTHGQPEGRAGGAATYDSPHIRERHYFADSSISVALVLDPADEPPSLDALAAALDHPARPLFLGRKPCLPSRPFFGGFADADDALAAVRIGANPDCILIARDRPGLPEAWERLAVTDERDWISGLHGGERLFRKGRAARLDAEGTA